jgi:hypothetical protein
VSVELVDVDFRHPVSYLNLFRLFHCVSFLYATSPSRDVVDDSGFDGGNTKVIFEL